MSRVSIIAFFVLLLSMQAQEPLDFFPHHVGDMRVYEPAPNNPRRYEKIVKDSVSGDSLLFLFGVGNGIDYTIDLKKFDVYFGVKHLLWYRLNVPWETQYKEKASDTGDAQAYREYQYELPGTVFGKEVKIRTFHIYLRGKVDTTYKSDGAYEYLASGFGLVLVTSDAMPEPVEYLTGCIINGDTLGDIRTGLVSVEEQAKEQTAASVFPNPAQDVVFINSGSMSSLPASIKVVTMQGEIIPVSPHRITTDVYSLDIRGWEQGAYTALVSVGREYKTVRFVVVR